ncbi:hypothetical protein [Psychrobacter sp. P11G5]|uniref:hypothetical protein n=1 Tax=Psychrobacter sp. P11G5 TaxID=1699624 RepID=UPI00078D9365|nr:hypothetical protein [Psychrobacter sp. P11G5]AMN68624.1 hypothetical protein AK825_13815 [Psychrobacter sp. P11G5]
MLQEKLFERYMSIAEEHQEFLEKSLSYNDLAKLLLGSVPDEYEQAPNKILIVGRETKGWLKSWNDFQYDKNGIKRSMDESKDFVRDQLKEKKKDTRGKSFFNFVRDIAKKSGDNGILWANIYASDYKGGHINHIKDKDMIKEIETISKKIIVAQIEVLNPDIIIFATGNQGIAARRRYFPNSELRERTAIEGYPSKDLWAFKLPDYDAQCYRIHHPSSFSNEKRQARQKLIEILPSI